MRPDLSEHQVSHLLRKDDELERLLSAYEELAGVFMRQSNADFAASFHPRHITNIVAVGVSRHMVKGKPVEQIGLKLMLREDTDQIDNLPAFPTEISGIAVHVEVVGRPVASAVFNAKKRPAPGGYSIGNAANAGESGTLGCLATYGGSKTGVLSNWHVLADVKAGSGTTIIQPGADAADGGSAPGDTIGALAYSVEPSWDSSARGDTDAALASVTDASDVSKALAKTTSETYPVGAGTTRPAVDMLVQKSGRTTGYTKGKVKAVGVQVNVGYTNGKTGYFKDTFTVEPSSGDWERGGDSGSLVTTQSDTQPVGLHFAGNGSGTLGWECEIDKVLTALGAKTGGAVTIQTG